MLEAWTACDGMVDAAIDSFDLDASERRFPGTAWGKLEHQLVNIRHIQHHTAQLADWLRVAKDVGVPWVGMRREQLKTTWIAGHGLRNGRTGRMSSRALAHDFQRFGHAVPGEAAPVFGRRPQ